MSWRRFLLLTQQAVNRPDEIENYRVPVVMFDGFCQSRVRPVRLSRNHE